MNFRAHALFVASLRCSAVVALLSVGGCGDAEREAEQVRNEEELAQLEGSWRELKMEWAANAAELGRQVECFQMAQKRVEAFRAPVVKELDGIKESKAAGERSGTEKKAEVLATSERLAVLEAINKRLDQIDHDLSVASMSRVEELRDRYAFEDWQRRTGLSAEENIVLLEEHLAVARKVLVELRVQNTVLSKERDLAWQNVNAKLDDAVTEISKNEKLVERLANYKEEMNLALEQIGLSPLFDAHGDLLAKPLMTPAVVVSETWCTGNPWYDLQHEAKIILKKIDESNRQIEILKYVEATLRAILADLEAD